MTLRDGSSDLVARFVPEAGMLATSLADAGVELLGQGSGLDAYLDEGVFMGIPIMYPWANRLGRNEYVAEGYSVSLSPDSFGVQTDGNGLLIHGLLTGYRGWCVTRRSDDELAASVDFGSDPSLMAGFPFAHTLSLDITLRVRALTYRTTVTATGDVAVPLCFGFHPYFQMPGARRADWVVETPATRHLMLDERCLPTGAATMQKAGSERLGHKVFDDGYDTVQAGAVFAVAAGGRRIEVHFDEGYRAAQIYAPADQDVICFEPMTAPTDALRCGGYHAVKPGESATATFSIRV